MKTLKAVLLGAVIGGTIGAASFGTIAAATPGAWSNLESTVIGLWLGVAFGAFFGLISQA